TLRLIEVCDSLLGYHMGNVISINHDRRHRHAPLRADLNRIERLHEGTHAALVEGLKDLDDELAAALRAGLLSNHVQPGRAWMPAATRIAAHVGRTAKAGEPAARHGRGV